jgi:hypothetical protein
MGNNGNYSDYIFETNLLIKKATDTVWKYIVEMPEYI